MSVSLRRADSWRRVDIAALGLLAVASYVLQALAWPLTLGRDGSYYLIYYVEYFRADPVYPQLMLFRTPGAPFFFGPLMELGGSVLVEVALAACFVTAIIAVYVAGSFWNRWIGVAAALALALHPAYGALYHEISSDGLFAFALALWLVLFCATLSKPTRSTFAIHGCALALLVLIRPAALIFIAPLALLPLLVTWLSIRERLLRAGVLLAATALLLGLWSVHNWARYGDLTVSRMSGAHMPFYRLYAHDRVVRPTNGPASRELARAVERDLLTSEPYRSYGIDVETFFGSATTLFWSDLVGLSDRTWGWDSDYSKLRAVAFEAIAADPFGYVKGVVRTSRELLLAGFYRDAVVKPPQMVESASRTSATHGSTSRGEPPLPDPPPGELIPGSRLWWLASTPDQSIWIDWSSLSEPRIRFATPDGEARLARMHARFLPMRDALPARNGSAGAAHVLNGVARLYPNMFVWLLVGAIGLLFRPHIGTRFLIFLALMALALVVGTALGEPPTPAYRIPVDSFFVLFGAAGIVGARHAARTLPREGER